MIYTLGHTKNYDQSFFDYGTVIKTGKNKEYVGGSVWKTYEEAEKNKPENFSVYGVLADWEKDTVRSEGNNWNDLLVDSKLVRIKKLKRIEIMANLYFQIRCGNDKGSMQVGREYNIGVGGIDSKVSPDKLLKILEKAAYDALITEFEIIPELYQPYGS